MSTNRPITSGARAVTLVVIAALWTALLVGCGGSDLPLPGMAGDKIRDFAGDGGGAAKPPPSFVNSQASQDDKRVSNLLRTWLPPLYDRQVPELRTNWFTYEVQTRTGHFVATLQPANSGADMGDPDLYVLYPLNDKEQLVIPGSSRRAPSGGINPVDWVAWDQTAMGFHEVAVFGYDAAGAVPPNIQFNLEIDRSRALEVDGAALGVFRRERDGVLALKGSDWFDFEASASTTYLVSLATLSGDADLYVYSETSSEFLGSSVSTGLAADAVQFTATTSGRHHVRVYGYEASDFTVLVQTSPIGGAAYTLADMQGTWQMHGLISGDAPQYTGWAHGKLSVDAGGSAAFLSMARSNGDNSLDSPFTFYLSVWGEVTSNHAGADLHGFMSADKRMVVMTMDDGGGGYGLVTLQKEQAVAYSLADLAGTWQVHALTSGDAPQVTGWAHGRMAVDGAGNAGFVEFLNSNGQTDNGDPATLGITGAGVVTRTDVPGGLHGFMSADKSTMVWTFNDGGGGYDLAVFQKEEGATYVVADLEGMWQMHGLLSGDAPQYIGWWHGRLTVNAGGNAFAISVARSNGDDSLGGAFNFGMTAGGVVSSDVSGWNLHGFVSADKQLVTWTMDDGGGGYGLVVMQVCP